MFSLRWRKTTLAASVLVGFVAATLGEDFLYHVTPLGKLPGAISCNPTDINDNEFVTGTCVFRDSVAEAYRWSPTEGMIGLGDFQGGYDVSLGEAINELGHVAGVSEGERGTEAFLWTPEEGMQGLGDLPKGGFRSWARGINNLNQITGLGTTKTAAGDKKHEEVFLWEADKGMWGLGDFPGGQEISIPADINDASQIVGWSVRFVFDEPFIWDPVNGMRPIRDLPGGERMADAVAINNPGQVAGLAAVDGLLQAAIWSEADGLVPLGTLGGKDPTSRSEDISDRGEVVGFSSPDSLSPWVPFVWDRKRGMRAVNDLLAARAKKLYFAVNTFAINNRGQLAGFAFSDRQGVLLTPFVLGDMNCDGTVDNADVEGFLLALLDFEEYQGRYPDCHGDWAADTNQDGSADLQDVEAFVELLLK